MVLGAQILIMTHNVELRSCASPIKIYLRRIFWFQALLFEANGTSLNHSELYECKGRHPVGGELTYVWEECLNSTES